MPGALIIFELWLIKVFLFNTLEMLAGLINPGLNIFGLEVKSRTVDSRPILHSPPFKIIFTELWNSCATSSADTGLMWDDLLALGIAKGKFKDFNIFLNVLFFGNLIATVFNFAVVISDNNEFFFFLKQT